MEASGFEPSWFHYCLKVFLTSQIESIFIHYKLCNAHHLFLLTEKKSSLIINLSNKCIVTSNRFKRYDNKVVLLRQTVESFLCHWCIMYVWPAVGLLKLVMYVWTVILLRDVDLNCLLHWCSGGEEYCEMLNAYFSLFICCWWVESLSKRRCKIETIAWCTLKIIV